MINEITQSIGTVEMVIDYLDGRQDRHLVKNAIMNTGRNALASCLANDIGNEFNLFVSQMIFGDGGTSSGVPKFVDSTRNGLFGVTRASKAVAAAVDYSLPSQVVFTTVLTFNDANGFALNEMALVLNTGDLYSMTTFADLNKTSAMQITFNWRISFV